MTAAELKAHLDVLRAANVMQARLKSGHEEIVVVFGPEPMDRASYDRATAEPGAWKTDMVAQPSDPEDPDPLNLGALDAEIAFDDPEVGL